MIGTLVNIRRGKKIRWIKTILGELSMTERMALQNYENQIVFRENRTDKSVKSLGKIGIYGINLHTHLDSLTNSVKMVRLVTVEFLGLKLC